MILSPLIRGQKGEHKDTFGAIHKQGFVRARVDGQIHELPTPAAAPQLKKTFAHNIEAIVDRIVLKPEIRSRLADSIETALKFAQGLVIVSVANADNTWTDQVFSEKFACPLHPEVSLQELEPRLFSFNSPHGACPSCHGLGTTCEFDPEMVVPDDSLSLENGTIEAWRKNGKRMNIFYSRVLRQFCRDFGISYSMPYKDIPKKVQQVLMYGTDAKGDQGTGTEFEGVIPNLQRRFENTESEFVKTRLHQYMSEQPCATCHGTRLKKEALAIRLAGGVRPDRRRKRRTNPHHTGPSSARRSPVKATATNVARASRPCKLQQMAMKRMTSSIVSKKHGRDARATKSAISIRDSPIVALPGFSIHDVTTMTVERAKRFFDTLRLGKEGAKDRRATGAGNHRPAGFMNDVGLGYLTLDRKTGSLSRRRGAARFDSRRKSARGLVGVCYVLDEPTIGLHQRDNTRLIRTLKRLQSIGNTVLMVEHDEDCIRAADYLIDIGPGAGAHGGHVVCAGPVPDVFRHSESLTIKYITGECAIFTPVQRRPVDPVERLHRIQRLPRE